MIDKESIRDLKSNCLPFLLVNNKFIPLFNIRLIMIYKKKRYENKNFNSINFSLSLQLMTLINTTQNISKKTFL